MFKSALMAACAVAATLGAAKAEAGVAWSIGIGLPPLGVVVGNAPAHHRGPPPVAYAPVPVYEAPVYAQPVYPAPVPAYPARYVAPPAVYAPVYAPAHRALPPGYGWRHRHREYARAGYAVEVPVIAVPVPGRRW